MSMRIIMTNTGSLRMVNSTFVWDISDFPNKCRAVGECIIESSYFAAGDIFSDKIKWFLRLYPFGRTTEYENFLSLDLCSNFCSSDTELEVSFKCYLWSNEINKEALHLKKFSRLTNSWGFPKFLDRNDVKLKNHLSSSTDSTLSIACCIVLSSCYVDSINLYPELVKGFNTFFLSDSLSDVTIEVGTEKLKAHKIILSANSEVFEAMFRYNMTESNQNIVKITDISCDVMTEVLHFIYCGEIKNIQLHKKKLLAAADKYSILLLKRVCEEALLRDIKVDNVCEILKISDCCQCPKLKEKSIDFIIKNMKAVVDTEGFKEIKDHNLLADILRQNALKETI